MTPPSLSIVIPVLNESAEITSCLDSLQTLREQGVEVVVVDGGSVDDTARLAAPLADLVITAPRGRALQMNAGAARSRGDYLLFLHADTRLPPAFAEGWLEGAQWGFFSVRLSGAGIALRFVEKAMCWRSRLSAIGTGDQGVFVRRDLFQQTGGFPAIPLMEDVGLCRQLKKRARPRVLSTAVLTSSRRWERRGVVRTVLQMWALRLAYFVGVPPRYLARCYYPDEAGFSR